MASRGRWRGGLLCGALVVQGAALAASCTTLGESDCVLLANTLGTVEASRCGGGDAGFVKGYDLVQDIAANGNCGNITAVRDQDQLMQCVACLLDASCYDAGALCSGGFDAAGFPATCDDQLQL
jgi:hypothetical protein